MFSEIPIGNLSKDFRRYRWAYAKSYVERCRPKIATTILIKKNEVGRHSADVKVFYAAVVARMCWYWPRTGTKSNETEQRTVRLSHTNSFRLTSTKVQKQFHGEATAFLSNDSRTIGQS